VLLNIFDLYRLAVPFQYGEGGMLNFEWRRQRWWYKLTYVCRQWRNIILKSSSRLDLHLYCTNGVPVADMLAHSPPLPLTIHYTSWRNRITAKDESGLLFALSHRDRVHHVDLWKLPNVDKFVTAMDDQFPVLEYVYIDSQTEVALPFTFQAPNLRSLRLWMVSLPIGSPLLTTSVAGLVVLSLLDIPPSAYFPPSYILTRLSLMAKLERLSITFDSPNRDVEGQSRQTPDMITLPNLRRILFRGTATYLESLVTWISAPSLRTLHVNLFHHLPLRVPRLCRFIQTEDLTFRAVQVTFGVLAISLHAVPWKSDTPLMLQLRCGHLRLDWQVAATIQFFRTLSPVLSVVDHVAFSHEEDYLPSEWPDDVGRRQWRELVRPFANVRTIHVKDDLTSKIFPSLQSDDGEPPLELLPKLEEIGYFGGEDAWDALAKFLNQRQVSGHPVSLRLVDPSMFDTPQYL
jgi:hypothetical protein